MAREHRHLRRGHLTSLIWLTIGTLIGTAIATILSGKFGSLLGVVSGLVKGSAIVPIAPMAVGDDNAQQLSTCTDNVDCSVFAPPAVPAGKRIRVQVFLHLEEQLSHVTERALRSDHRAVDLGTQTLTCPIRRGSEVDLELEGDGLHVEDALQSLVWRGRPESRSFVVRIPTDIADGHEFLPRVTVYLDGTPIGRITFSIACMSVIKAERVVSELRGRAAKRYKNIFFSYSTHDRAKVSVVARSYSLLEQEFFQDITNLESGERWEGTLLRKIEEADLFILFPDYP